MLQKPIFNFLCGSIENSAVKSVFESASSAAAAQLATSPTCALMFKTVPLLGVLANIAAVWLLQPIMALGIISLAAGSISPLFAYPFIFSCQLLIHLLLAIAEFFASVPFITLHFIEYWQIIWLIGAVVLSIIIICRIRSAKATCITAVGLSAVYVIAAVVAFGLSVNRADIITFEQNNCAAVIKGGHAILLGTPKDKWQRSEITDSLSLLGVEQLDAIVINDSNQANYSTARLAADFNCSHLCAPNDRTAAAFCHSSNMQLCELPHNSTLFDKMTLTTDANSIELLFKNGKLLKTDDNCDIIGRYSYPMPIKDIIRYRINL